MPENKNKTHKKQKKTENNFAFIDSQNLYLSIRSQWWEMDYWKFLVYLKDKFKVNKIFLFIWYLPWNESLYTELQEYWYILVFKPIMELKDGNIKWNVDAELVLHTMIHYENFDKAIIISWDWDFHCLIEYLEQKDKLKRLIIPNRYKYSALLRRFNDYIFYLSNPNLREKIWKIKDKKNKKKENKKREV